MRYSYIYDGFNEHKLIRALLNLSKNIDYISVLLSNIDKNISRFPRDYMNFDIIAGVGFSDAVVSNLDSFENLKTFHNQNNDWLFGYLSYDLKNEIEVLSSKNNDNFQADNLSFFIPEYVLFLKNEKLEIQTYNSKHKCDQFVKNFNFTDLLPPNLNVNLIARDKKASYLSKISAIKEHIQRGDIYEMNYCQEFYAKGVKVDPEQIFFSLNNKMLAPFSSFLKLKDRYILSASPERFLRKQSNNILSQPIKGTRKRGITDLEDMQLIHDLATSQKDIAENVMITDLVRNDLSITAIQKSVKVENLCKVYTFKQVHQMITTVSSDVSSEINFTDILKTIFPMGSMTGAPKLRAMELIEYFENFKRGVFSGAVGYITPSADFDFNVVIRTILYNLASGYLSIGVGGAITINSDPLDEYHECLIKVKPILDVLNFTVDD